MKKETLLPPPLIYSSLKIFLVITTVVTLIISTTASATASNKSGKSMSEKDLLSNTAQSAQERSNKYIESLRACEEEGQPNLDCMVKNIQESILIKSTKDIAPGGENDDSSAYLGPSATESLTGLIGNMYEPNNQPASSRRYLAYVLNSANIVQPAFAQGIGFSSLDPILNVWVNFRNIAYLFFVLLFLIIGFLIMFRHKIDGQTVVNVQQAIPSIIVALVFVTFSYAIGGFLIDAMYLVMFLIVGLFESGDTLINANIFELGTELISVGFNASQEAIKSIAEAANVGIISGIGGLTLGFIVAIALLYGIIKLFIELLKSYVSIILLIVFSPMLLMISAIPGNKAFSSWIKNIIGNLAAFPVVLLILVIQDQIKSSDVVTGGFAPPFLIGPSLGGGTALTSLVGIGMLLAIPEIVKKVKDGLGAKEGVMGELAGAAWDRFKKGAGTAKPILTGVGAVAGAGLGGGLGAAGGALGGIPHVLSGKETPEHLKIRAKRGAGKGALFGAGIGPALSIGPEFISSQAKTIKNQMSQVLTSKAAGGASAYLKSKAHERSGSASSNILTMMSNYLQGVSDYSRHRYPTVQNDDQSQQDSDDQSQQGSQENPSDNKPKLKLGGEKKTKYNNKSNSVLG